jgi:hypothetical protein
MGTSFSAKDRMRNEIILEEANCLVTSKYLKGIVQSVLIKNLRVGSEATRDPALASPELNDQVEICWRNYSGRDIWLQATTVDDPSINPNNHGQVGGGYDAVVMLEGGGTPPIWEGGDVMLTKIPATQTKVTYRVYSTTLWKVYIDGGVAVKDQDAPAKKCIANFLPKRKFPPKNP